MELNIIPASAPTGVKYAPMLEPIIAPKTAGSPPPDSAITEENSTLMGILFNTFAAKKEVTP